MRTAARWPRIADAAPQLALIALILAGSTSQSGAPQRVIDDYSEIHEHLIGEPPLVETDWVDITVDRIDPWWNLLLDVDATGTVTNATLQRGDRQYQQEALQLARALRFRPFLRDGQPTPVTVDFDLHSRPRDYTGPEDRSFPADADRSSLVVALARTGCLGTCPSYRVELRGNGEVVFRGDQDVLVRGTHRWRIDPEKVTELLELLQASNYFSLAGSYEAPVTDLPAYLTRVSLGDHHKVVLDYGGGFGQAVASTQTGGDFPQMPEVVTRIEDAIDRISGARSYVDGDDTTFRRLRDERFNFRSERAGHGLRKLLSDCNTELARKFIRAGAPIGVAGNGYGAGFPILFAARCADGPLVRELIARGALRRASVARQFLFESAASGDPDMVALALAHHRNVNIFDEEGEPLLSRAVGSYSDDDAPNAARFDSTSVVEMLIDAGADPNARDGDGRTPLFEADSPEMVTALLRRGADPHARDAMGRTALFDEYFWETKPTLIAAGADVNARDARGRTALFVQGPQAVEILLKAGADIEARDDEGFSVLERMTSESVVKLLLAAGAKLPEDPRRLEAMLSTARKKDWPEVVSLIEATARK